MARIIKPGVRKAKELRGTCGQCDCVFAPEPMEVKTQEMGGGEFVQYAYCPCCGNKVAWLREEWVIVHYGKPKPPNELWYTDHIEPPKPRL